VRLVRRIAKVATDVMFADVRHFDPEDDGYWDGHRYDIDEAFPEVAGLVAAHRISNALAVRA
jgi:hypothetical protein